MSVTPASYATPEEYRLVVGAQSTAKDADIEADLAAVSRMLEGKLNRFFWRDSEPVLRSYIVPDQSSYLWIDDLSEAPETVRINGVEIESSGYELLPLNAHLGPEPRPFTRLQLRNGSFWQGARLEIEGRWGWLGVPAAIERATIQLTALLRLETARSTRRIPELEDAIEATPDAQRIVKQLTDQYARFHYA